MGDGMRAVLAARTREGLAEAIEALEGAQAGGAGGGGAGATGDGSGAVKWVCFWGHTAKAGAAVGPWVLSQWWPCRFSVGGLEYQSTEHWMMAHKALLFGDDAAVPGILGARTPAEAKKLGRLVRGFDEARWQAACFEIVTSGNVHKFGQDPVLRDYLLGTANRVLVEASPRDLVWGIGLGAGNEAATDPRRWRGRNLLGFALMEARERLAAGQGEADQGEADQGEAQLGETRKNC